MLSNHLIYKYRKTVLTLLGLLLFAIIFTALAIILKLFPIQARIQLDLTVERMTFTTGEEGSILDSLFFKAMSVEKLSQVKLSPTGLEVGNPKGYDAEQDQYLKWDPVTNPPQSLLFKASDSILQPNITFSAQNASMDSLGHVNKLDVITGSEVAIQLSGGQQPNLMVRVDTLKALQASFPEPFYLTTRYVDAVGITVPQVDRLRYRMALAEHNPIVNITSQDKGLILNLSLTAQKDALSLPNSGIPVTSVGFIRQNSQGQPESTLIKAGSLHYVDYPSLAKVDIAAADFVHLGGLADFRIVSMALGEAGEGLVLHLDGNADEIQIGHPPFVASHHLTYFTWFWENAFLGLVGGIFIVVLGAMIGSYKLFWEVKQNVGE